MVIGMTNTEGGSADRTEYYRRWYEKNKARVSRARAHRWATDPKFRAAKRRRDDALRAEKTPVAAGWVREVSSSYSPGATLAPRVFLVKGSPRLCRTFHAFAAEVKVSPKCLASWVSKGLVPEGIKDEAGHMWHWEHEIEIVKSQVEKGRQNAWTTEDLARALKILFR